MVVARSSATEKLPVPPPLVARVVELASDPEVEPSKLAQLITVDPVISSRLIGIANSSFHAPRSPIGSVERAVNFLGLRAVRNLVLCLGVTKLFPESELKGFPLDKFWESSLRRAAAARCLARRLGMPGPDELFAIGLCQDLGVLRRARQDADARATATTSFGKPSEERWLSERTSGQGHDQLTVGLLRRWGFPEELVQTVQYHHQPDAAPPALQKRALVCHAAESLADIFACESKHDALRAAERAIEKLGLELHELPEIVAELSAAVAESAMLLDLRVGMQPSYAELAARACEGLFELNLSYEELLLQLKETLAEKELLACELKRLNRELEERAMTDALTGLQNRRAFETAIARELAQSQRTGRLVSLLMVDVDHFKKVNDTFGHAAGDEVLRSIARAILASIRTSDTAARTGGEEFAVILPGTTRENALLVAERLRKNVSLARSDFGGKSTGVTVSVGGVTVVGARELEPGVVVASSDKALYKAKQSGRDRVVWGELEPGAKP